MPRQNQRIMCEERIHSLSLLAEFLLMQPGMQMMGLKPDRRKKEYAEIIKI